MAGNFAQPMANLIKAEDAAAVNGDLGLQLLTVRKDTAAATSGTDGDYQPATTDAFGRVHVNVGYVKPATSVYFGQKTIASAGSEAAIASTQALRNGVYVKALAANTGLVYVGTGTVTSATGYQLSAKEYVFIPCDDVATIVIDVAVNNEGISYIAT